jgi:PPOX class probable F420-dependent enzyme
VAELTDELRAFLRERRYAVLATQDAGPVHLTPIWFLFEDDRFWFESFSGSGKVANLRRNPTASVVVDAREPGRERWVAAAGTVEILDGDVARGINARIRHRYLTPAALGDERVGPVYAVADDVTLKLTPARWTAWDSKSLDAQLFGGILGADPDRWFLPVVR